MNQDIVYLDTRREKFRASEILTQNGSSHDSSKLWLGSKSRGDENEVD